MTPPTGRAKLKFLVKSNVEFNPISKPMKCLFLLFHTIFALDFGFINFKSPGMKMFVKLFYSIQASAVTIIVIYILYNVYPQTPNTVWMAFDCLVYLISALFLFISKNTFRDFLFALHTFDAEISVNSSSYKTESKILLHVLFVVLFRMFVSYAHCWIRNKRCFYSLYVMSIYFIAFIGAQIVLVVYTFLFLSINHRIKNFAKFMRKDNVDIIECHYLYKRMAEITEKTKKSFDFIYVVALVFNTVDTTLTIFKPLNSPVSQWGYTLEMPLAYILVIQELVMIFSPAITAGLLASQVERLRLVLYDRLVKDQKHTRDIKRFIDYIEVRPLRFKVWTVIPLDWSLPIIVLNLCVTYLIVMIQFTQKN